MNTEHQHREPKQMPPVFAIPRFEGRIAQTKKDQSQNLPEVLKRRWMREHLRCAGCGKEIATETLTAKSGLAYERCFPNYSYPHDPWYESYGDLVPYCTPACKEAAVKRREDGERATIAAFNAKAGKSLAVALETSAKHIAYNDHSPWGFASVVQAEREDDGRIHTLVYMLEGEYKDLYDDTPADVDRSLFSDYDPYFGCWDGPESWYPG